MINYFMWQNVLPWRPMLGPAACPKCMSVGLPPQRPRWPGFLPKSGGTSGVAAWPRLHVYEFT